MNPDPSCVIVLMGVAGSGKTTVGRQLATELGWPFRDADEFHPAQNIAKMTAGIPLEDADREPWLLAIREFILGCLATNTGAVVTCSALKSSYREVIVPDPPRVKLVHLSGSFGLILQRMTQREDHFMKPEMLRSQFDALERPTDALEVDVAQSVDAIVASIREALRV